MGQLLDFVFEHGGLHHDVRQSPERVFVELSSPRLLWSFAVLPTQTAVLFCLKGTDRVLFQIP